MRRIDKESSVFDYSPKNPPCLRVDPGEVVTFEVVNRFADLGDLAKALRRKERSPLFSVTGPLYISGAAPGKTLRVEILKLRLTSQEGYCVLLPSRGYFGRRIRKKHIRQVRIEKQGIRFAKRILLPLTPMVGRIGVSPRRGSFLSHLPGPYGGNLDCKEIGAGATVYLPIFAEGGLLALGDIHAAMGDGECGLSGVETQGEVTLRCSVIDRPLIREPWVVTKKEVMALASAVSLEQALKKSLLYMGGMLQSRLGLTFEEALMLMSGASNVGICQMVNPLVTAKTGISKSVLTLE